MSDHLLLPSAALDYESLTGQTIDLTADQLDRAATASLSVDASQQWQAYLNALAKFGVEEWLHERSLTSLNTQDPRLQVGEFKLGILATGSLSDEIVTVPAETIAQPELAAHFYLLVEVAEEQGHITLQGFLRYDELTARQVTQSQAAALHSDADGAYEVPLAWFNPDLDKLTLYLRCLEPIAIVLPVPTVSSAVSSGVSSPISSAASRPASSVPLTQSVVNAALWLRDRVDDLADDLVNGLAWTLMPPLATASALRSTTSELDAIAIELRRSEFEIPSHARIAYRDLTLHGLRLRLYAVVWTLSETLPEWALLLILGNQPNATLPQPVKLQIRDAEQTLVERILQQDQEYIYGSVIGEWHEQFTATIDLMDGRAIVLPAFAFDLQP